jgi:hypothetical protein
MDKIYIANLPRVHLFVIFFSKIFDLKTLLSYKKFNKENKTITTNSISKKKLNKLKNNRKACVYERLLVCSELSGK